MSSSGDVMSPAFQQVTPNNHGPWVIVTSYIFIPLTMLVVAIRLVSRYKITRVINLNDYLIVVATLLAFLQTICLTLACNNGLGRHRTALSESSFEKYSKYFYASEILLIAAVAFAKASITLLIVAIKPNPTVLKGCRALLVVIAVWAIISIFALAFQCDLPRPWDSTPGRCINQHALLIWINIVNIITDIATIVLSFFLMRNVQVSQAKRLTVVALFACRIIVPIITIPSLTTLSPYFFSSPPDHTWHAVAPAIWSQVMLNLSIITACIPSLKRFLAELQSGAFAVNISESFEMGGTKKTSSSQDAYARGSNVGLGSRIASRFKSQPRSNMGTAAEKDNHEDSNMEDMKYGYMAHGHLSISQDNPFHPTSATHTSTVERSDSIKGLTENVINRTTEFKVEYESRSSEGSGSGDRPSPVSRDIEHYGEREGDQDRISVI